MPKKDLERIKAKINELDSKLDKSIEKNFAYLGAILQILRDKGIADEDEIIRYLEHHKKGISKISQDVDFWKIVEQFKKKRKKKS